MSWRPRLLKNSRSGVQEVRPWFIERKRPDLPEPKLGMLALFFSLLMPLDVLFEQRARPYIMS